MNTKKYEMNLIKLNNDAHLVNDEVKEINDEVKEINKKVGNIIKDIENKNKEHGNFIKNCKEYVYGTILIPPVLAAGYASNEYDALSISDIKTALQNFLAFMNVFSGKYIEMLSYGVTIILGLLAFNFILDENSTGYKVLDKIFGCTFCRVINVSILYAIIFLAVIN